MDITEAIAGLRHWLEHHAGHEIAGMVECVLNEHDRVHYGEVQGTWVEAARFGGKHYDVCPACVLERIGGEVEGTEN